MWISPTSSFQLNTRLSPVDPMGLKPTKQTLIIFLLLSGELEVKLFMW